MAKSDLDKIKIILIHGNGGAGSTHHWFPYVVKESEKLGIKAIAKDFPDPFYARKQYWLPYIKELGADENTILIGHSSGGVAALRYAEENKLLGSILVGVNYTDLGDEMEKQSGYFDTPWQWDKIKANQQWITVIHSLDDPFIPIAQPQFIAEQTSADYYEFRDQQHFGHDAEHTKLDFPEIMEVIKNRLNITTY